MSSYLFSNIERKQWSHSTNLSKEKLAKIEYLFRKS